MSAAEVERERPHVVVTFEAAITLDAEVDLVTYFTAFPEGWRERYFAFDLDEQGFEEEWERPLAWLVAELGGNAMGSGACGPGVTAGFDDGDVDDWRINRLTKVLPEDNFLSHMPWDEEDFEVLAAAVPWLNREGVEEPDPEMLARMPGPHDVPLPFDE